MFQVVARHTPGSICIAGYLAGASLEAVGETPASYPLVQGFFIKAKGESMNTINILKRSLVLSGAVLVIAVPAAQAHRVPWAQNSAEGMGHHSSTDLTASADRGGQHNARSIVAQPCTCRRSPRGPGDT